MGERLSLTLDASDDPSRVADAVAAFADAHALLMPTRYALDLVLEEVVTNVAKYGAGAGGATITINVQRDGDAILGRVEDDAAPFDPLSGPPVDTTAPLEEREVGGLGLHLITEMTDSLNYLYERGRNVLTFRINMRKDMP